MSVVLRETVSICPICKKEIKAQIIEKNSSIFLGKECPEHKSFEVKIAQHAWYYKGLTQFYDHLYPSEQNPKATNVFVTFLTSRCNLHCPICFTNANSTQELPEISTEFIKTESA